MPYVSGNSVSTTSKASDKAAAWSLEVPEASESRLLSTESTIVPDDGSHGSESIIGKDERVQVDRRDIHDGGKYRSIVKIQSCFKDPSTDELVWMMGTGWLIQPDLLITAGHVVYDWGRGYGPTTQIKCYIGYDGRASVNGPHVQPRYGKNVITTSEWIKTPDDRLRDVAFIQVHKPFEGNLSLINYVDTPKSDSTFISIVGYPGDRSLGPEIGAQMYEMSLVTDYDIDDSKRHMLEYRISTFGGQSGAPILRRQDGVTTSVGTHCYGGGGKDSNSGNSIGGQWGNKYKDFVNLFSLGKSQFGTAANIRIVDIKARDSSRKPTPDSEEGFLDILKGVAKIGSGVLPAAGSMLGPVGAVVGIAAGALLGSISEAAFVDSEGTFVKSTLVNNGAAERAMLAEASLQAILRLKETPEASAVIQRMNKIWTNNAPHVDDLAKALTPQLTECALSMTLERLAKASKRLPSGKDQETAMQRRPLDTNATESVSSQQEAFIEGLFGPTLSEAGEEGVFSWLGPMLDKAVTLAKPLVSQAAKAAINELAPKLVDKIVGRINGGTESDLMQLRLERREPEMRLLLKRALVADTALQALSTLSKSDLDKLLLTKRSGESEGLFDSIKGVVQKYGPTILDIAKEAIKTYAPVVIKAAADHFSESSLSPSISPARSRSTNGDTPYEQRSILELLEEDHVSQLLSEDIKEASKEGQDYSMLLHYNKQPKRTMSTFASLPTSTDTNDDRMPILTVPPADFSA